MQDQPKYKYERGQRFLRRWRSDRPEVEGTIARGSLNEDVGLLRRQGRSGQRRIKDIDTFPLVVDKALIERGQQRFDAFCSPCHGRIGNGLGMIVRRGFKQPPSYHIDRLRNAPVGHFYDVITNGYGAMLNYAQQLARARPLGGRSLYPGAPVQPERQHERSARGGAAVRSPLSVRP